MRLRDSFKTKEWLFKQALRENDTALLQALFEKDATLDLKISLLRYKNFENVTVETARFLAKNYTKEVNERWGFGNDAASGVDKIQTLFMRHLMMNNPSVEVVEAFLDSPVPPQDAAQMALHYLKDEEDRLRALDKIFAKGIAKFSAPEELAQKMIDDSRLPEFDRLVEAGLSLHKDNEALLRYAAQGEKKEMVTHMVLQHSCDIDLAVRTVRVAGNDKIQIYLEGMRSVLKPEAPPVQSFEDLAREVKELREAMHEMTALVRELQAERTLDKSVDKPRLRTTGNTP